jgi:hypothetical protein
VCWQGKDVVLLELVDDYSFLEDSLGSLPFLFARALQLKAKLDLAPFSEKQ